nr:tripartite tricarboxylate transporter TctB family protein [uncultured Halomonas sp.]
MKDIILGLCFMVLGGITIAIAQQYPTMPSLQYGPSLFPSLIGGGFFIGGLVLIATQVVALRQRSGGALAGKAIDYRMFLVSLLPCALVVFYILGSEYLGAAVAMAIIMFVLMLVRKTPFLLALAVAVVASLFIHFVFSKYLLIPLPEGLLSVGG